MVSPAFPRTWTDLSRRLRTCLLQIRGEPKSGTTFMYEWAANALQVACAHIEHMYGVGTCSVKFELVYSKNRTGEIVPLRPKSTTKNMKQLFLDFEPKRGRGSASSDGTDVDATCPCENVDR